MTNEGIRMCASIEVCFVQKLLKAFSDLTPTARTYFVDEVIVGNVIRLRSDVLVINWDIFRWLVLALRDWKRKRKSCYEFD
jgi:hypothetical protein